jgi:hypothetical protein
MVKAEHTRDLRKRILNSAHAPATTIPADLLDIAAVATVIVTSEALAHPVDNIFDNQQGPGASRWVAGELGEQSLILDFDTPQTLRRLRLEVEEDQVSRSQELWVSVSADGGHTYREVVRQEYNFSPPATTFEREEWQLLPQKVTHLWIRIKPDKGDLPCKATLTSLMLFT